jgi:isochorismate pyruvate lyase
MTATELDVGEPDGLDDIRKHIDALDRRIVRLIAQREAWVRRAGGLKSDPSQAAAPERAARVVDAAAAFAAEAGANPEVVRVTYVAMVAAFVQLEADTISEGSEAAETTARQA